MTDPTPHACRSPLEHERDAGPFVSGARVETMLRDFNRLREAIRAHDSFATEAAWEKCERWVSCLSPSVRSGR
jgi:hypothetical protein